MKKLISLLLVLSMAVSLAVPAGAAEDATAATMRLESTEGTVTVKNASGLSVKQKNKMRLYDGYSVKTAAKSYAYISLDGDKTLKLDASSEASVSKSGKKLEIVLVSGSLFFNVAKPLERSESLNIRTATMVTGVRGTSACVSAPNRHQTEITLLTGRLEVTGQDSHSGQMETVEMNAGERAVVAQREAGTPQEHLEIQKLSAQEAALPGFAAVEVAKDPELQSRIEAETELSVSRIVEDAAERLTADETAAQQAAVEVREKVEEQVKELLNAIQSVFDRISGGSSSSSGGGSSGGSGSGGGGSTPAPVTHTVALSGEHFAVGLNVESASPGAQSFAVQDGADFSFYLEPAGGYEIAGVTCGEQTLTPDGNGKYTVGRVNGDMTVTVTTKLTTHTVKIEGTYFTADTGTSYTVQHNQDLTFTLKPQAGYEIDTVTCGGELLTANPTTDPTTKEYSIGPVNKETTVTVTMARNLTTSDLGDLVSALADKVTTVNLTTTNLDVTSVSEFTIPEKKTLNLKSGTLNIYRDVSINGALTTDTGTTLTFGFINEPYGYGHTTVNPGGNLTVQGDLMVNEANLVNDGGKITFSDSSNARIIGSGYPMSNRNGGKITIAGKLTVENSYFGSSRASLQNNDGCTLTVESTGSLTISGNGELINSGTMNVITDGTLKIERGTNPSYSGTLTNIGTLTNGGTINNLGTLTVDSGGTLANNSAITSSGPLTNDGTLDNAGTLEIISYGTLTNNGALNNSSMLTVESSDLEVSSGSTLTNSGTLTVNNGALTDSGTLTNSGTLTVNSGSLTVSGGGKLDITGGSVANPTLAVPLSIAADGIVNLSGGTLGVSQVTGSGTLNWTGGTIECTQDGTNVSPAQDSINLVLGSGSSIVKPTSGEGDVYAWTLTSSGS